MIRMISKYKSITTETPIKQIWKQLRRFLEVPYTMDFHCEYVGIEKRRPEYKKNEANLKKQAIQIGYCIRQAEEYFHAFTEVSLPTRPLLLYYGATSLSTALMLIRNDGGFSLDQLPSQHKSHGLELKLLNTRNVIFEEPNSFFNSIGCSFLETGFFSLFYESLIRCVYHVDGEIHDVIPNTFGSKTFLRNTNLLTSAGAMEKADLLLRRLSALEIIQMMPDMYTSLEDLKIESKLCQGSISSRLERFYSSPNQGIKHHQSKSTINFFINNLTEEQRERFIKMYEGEQGMRTTPNFGLNLSILRLQSVVESDKLGDIEIAYPDIVDDINGQKYYVQHPEDYLCEPAQHFILLYCLGMLSRYHPHIWMKAISNSQIAEFTDSLLMTIYRKFPNLILDQMTETRYYVHQ